MRLFVTGGNGFIGTAVVATALTRGHEVIALVRPAADLRQVSWASDRAVSVVRGDLREPGPWLGSLGGVDAVVHLAAAFGTFADQFAATVVGTENLLAAMGAAHLSRLVLVSTFSVYGYRALPVGASLDESTANEPDPASRDDYTRTKLEQERLVIDFAAGGGEVTVIRPGAVYGPGKLWDGGSTIGLGGRWSLAIGPRANLKLTYVENCAEAILLAAERPEAIGATVNVVDGKTNQRQYSRALRRHGFAVHPALPIPYRLAWLWTRAIESANRRLLDGRARLPELAEPARLDARCKPLRYSAARARQVLGWSPRFDLDTALDRTRANVARAAERDSPP